MHETVKRNIDRIQIAAFTIGAVAVVAITVGLHPSLAAHFQYATPFSIPSHLSYGGRNYVSPHCESTRELKRDRALPLTPVASLSGYLTSGKTIGLPPWERRSLDAPPGSMDATPAVVYLSARGCQYEYALSGGP